MAESLAIWSQLPIFGVYAGIHQPGPPDVHADRSLPCFELIFMQQGVLPISERDRDFELQRHDALLLFPNRRHFSKATFSDDMWFYWVCFQAPGWAENQPASSNAEQLVQVPQRCKPARPPRLVELFERLLADLESGMNTPTSAGLSVLLMLEELVKPAGVPTEDINSFTVLARRAAAHVRSHFANDPDLSTASVAEALNCHPDYLGRVFKQATGRTLVEHIHKLRMDQARSLLLRSGSSVEEVARAVGMPDVRYFRRIFKRHTGMTPTAFRRLDPRRR